MAKTSLFFLLSLQLSQVWTESYTYKDHEEVPLYVNKVGPYYNPHETYHYYSMPVCRPEKIEHRSMSLGEVLDGDRMAKSLYKINYKDDVAKARLCSLSLGVKELSQMQEAIEDLYYFEFVVDDISIKNFMGQLEEGPLIPHVHRTFLWTHYHFTFEYNDHRVVNANVSTRDSVELTSNMPVPFEVTYTYSVEWKHTETKYQDRASRYENSSFFPKTLEIHWLSVINSIVLVFLLVGFVLVILTRVLKNDFARYNVVDQERVDEVDEYGWKIIHTDVFRFPPNRMLFCAVLGVGSQLLCMMAGILLLALTGWFNVHRHGSLNTAGCFLYAFTAFIAGYVACGMYKQMGFGHAWVKCVHLTSCLFAIPFFVIWSFQNSVALAYTSTQALPFSTIMLLICVWLFIGYPLTILGGIFGKNRAGEFNAPCRAKNIPREIPDIAWYQSWPVHCVVGGFLPFSAISVELYYIFATLWGREQYTLYGILALVFIILLSVTAAVAMALTYFQLTAEDYRWWWRSVFSAGSTGGFVLLYSLFYYFERSNMSGVLQTIEFFCWTLLTCYAFFLALGTVSFFASLQLVRYIYRNIKMD